MRIEPSLFAFWVLYTLFGLGVFMPDAANGVAEVWLVGGLFGALITTIALVTSAHFRKKAKQFSLINCTPAEAGKVLMQVRRDPDGPWLIHSCTDGEIVKRAITPHELPLFQLHSLHSRIGECWRIYTINARAHTIACQNI